jgi:hypothetical protein
MNHEAFPPVRRSLHAASPLPVKARAASRSDSPSTPTNCEEAIEALIALAHATLSDPAASVVLERGAPKRGAAPSRGANGRAARPSATAQQQLTQALRGLEPELALKVRTLMVAGRDGQSIHAVKIHMTLADGTSGFHAAADDISENGPLLAEYLRRGHALAHASGLELERPIAGWASADGSRAERDWQRFGRQLAQSDPNDWHCLLVTAPSAEHGSQLYLQHAEHGSWSFHARLIRTEPGGLEGLQHGSRAGSLSVSTRSLGALVPRLRKAQGLALRRAARAICARVGTAAQP